MKIDNLEKIIQDVIQLIYPGISKIPDVLLVPSPEGFGDFSTNVPFDLASMLHKSPVSIAEEILKHLNFPYFSSISVAKPGYLNFSFALSVYRDFLQELEEKGEKYFYKERNGMKVQIEFVSANPTGPLHVGNGRGGIIGDVLGNLLKVEGFDVIKEYYVNDAGSKMNLFAKSIAYYYMKKLGKNPEPVEEAYRGAYIEDIATEILNDYGDSLLNGEGRPLIDEIQKIGKEKMMYRVKESLEKFGVAFDSWFYESSLYSSGEVDKITEIFKKSGYAYEKDDALWFQSTLFGDDKDRVLVRGTGEPTYTLVDAAYHKNKWDRGFKKVIDIWGADHFGHITPMKALIQGMGLPEDFLDIIIYQIVHLFENGKEVMMSKHSGTFVTLEELVNEVGRDAARFFFLLKSSDTHLNFDIDLAKRESIDNPVYYVQYTYARLKSILWKGEEKGIRYRGVDEADLSLFESSDERALLNHFMYLEKELERVARKHSVHRIPFITIELCKKINTFYQNYNILSSEEYVQPRLSLVYNALNVLSFLMNLMEIEKKERM
jgi:arginyl-tRNA synthetase